MNHSHASHTAPSEGDAPPPATPKPASAPATREDSEDVDESESTGGSALEEQAARGDRAVPGPAE